MATYEDKYVIDTSDAEKALKKLDTAVDKFGDNAEASLEDLQDQFKELNKRADKLADATQKNNRQTIKSDKDLIAIREAQTRQYKEFGAAAASAFTIIAAYSGDAIANAREAAAVEAQLAAAIESTGGAAGQSLEALTDHAGALQKITNFSDDVIEGGQGVLLTFENIKETFPEATAVMLDMAERMGKDVPAAAKELGKILNIPTEAAAKLKKLGIELTEQQKEQIKAFVEAGNTAAAQKIILDELQKTYGGAAQAARDAAGGQKDLEVSTNELSEAWGRLLLSIGDAGVTGGIAGFLDALASGADIWTATVERAQTLGASMDDLHLQYNLNLEGFTLLANGLAELNPFVILKNGVTGFYDKLKEGGDVFEAWRAGIENMVAGLGDVIAGALDNFTNIGAAINTPPPVAPTPAPSNRPLGLPPAGTSHGPPRRQFGGPVAGGASYLVGEAGPELFVPPGAGTIVPNSPFVGSAFTPQSAINSVSNSQSSVINLPSVGTDLLAQPVFARTVRNLILREMGKL